MPSITRGRSAAPRPLDERLTLLRRMYANDSREQILAAFPDYSWQAVKSAAHRHGWQRKYALRPATTAPVAERKTGLPAPMRQSLRDARIERRMTCRQLADFIGYEPSALRKWERGDQSPSVRALQNWCESLGFEVSIAPRAVRLMMAAE